MPVGGDFNIEPQAPAIERLGRSLHDGWQVAGSGDGITHPGEDQRIDYLFVSEQIEVTREWVPAEDVSDHRPLAAELAL